MFALALSIGVLGGIATWLSLSPLAGMVTIWAIFIAWGAYFHNGANTAALKNTIVCGIFGSVLAGIAFALITKVGLGQGTPLAVNAAVWVGLAVFVLVMGATIPAFSVIPTAVYGFAATAAYAIHAGPELSTAGNTLAMDFSNPVIVISLSFIVGALFGMVSGKVAAMISGQN
ncbi:hypothetical protein LCGC14_0575460 [marine sediment metagenome]|uniref:DUF1097 domain-containing protein n=1 Tax=marine sediment metagenome TaxID=412755 RepID=A0A0F9UR87_9ZZZZ|nr:DUF1097 domain-containing protein [Methylophaga sp.]HEC59517.1 DUF1097 domain-containing protein [Methylophaga sp.]